MRTERNKELVDKPRDRAVFSLFVLRRELQSPGIRWHGIDFEALIRTTETR